jgi:hypothetical protein
LESKLNPKPESENIPTKDGGYWLYKAAGKLSNKRAIITGEDSGIGRSIAILFAMEGAGSLMSICRKMKRTHRRQSAESRSTAGSAI